MKNVQPHSPENLKRLEKFRVEPLVKFGPPRWRDLVKESERKREHFESVKSTRPWVRWRELRGLAAEEVVSVVIGIPRKKGFTDGGEDFFKTDVKAIPPIKPVLAVPTKDGNGGPFRFAAPYFVCVVVDIEHHWGTPIGWATKDQMRNAPVIKMPHGPSYVLYPWELNEGLPDELLQYAKLIKAI